MCLRAECAVDYRAGAGAGTRPLEMALVGVLLLAAPLGKEYGLAFATAIGIVGVFERRRDYVLPALLAGVAYVSARLVLADGAVADYCEDMGYFLLESERCFGPTHPIHWRQLVYNVAIGTLGAMFPGWLTEEGRLTFQPARFAFGTVMVTLAIVGLVHQNRRVALTLATIIAANGALSFLLFRPRNQLIVAAVISIAAGSGLATLRAALVQMGSPRLLGAAMAVALALAAVLQSMRTREWTQYAVIVAAETEPCDAVVRDTPLDAAFIHRVKVRFGLPDPSCSDRGVESTPLPH